MNCWKDLTTPGAHFYIFHVKSQSVFLDLFVFWMLSFVRRFLALLPHLNSPIGDVTGIREYIGTMIPQVRTSIQAMWSQSWINPSGCYTVFPFSFSFSFVLFLSSIAALKEKACMATLAALVCSEQFPGVKSVKGCCCNVIVSCIVVAIVVFNPYLTIVRRGDVLCRSLLFLVCLFRIFFFFFFNNQAISSRVTIQQTGKHFCL